jgi:hypothetical protein
MNKLSKEKRDKLLLIALGTGGLLAALYLMVISAQNTALAEYSEKTEAAKEKLAKAERWLRMAPTIQTRLDSNRRELEGKQAEMAPVDKFKWFYDTLDKFLAQRSVKLTDITREPEIGAVGILPKFPYEAATFGLKLNARYKDLGAFLSEFENQFPYMRVNNLDIEPEGSVKVGTKELIADPRQRGVANLAITLRVVTLIRPAIPL